MTADMRAIRDQAQFNQTGNIVDEDFDKGAACKFVYDDNFLGLPPQPDYSNGDTAFAGTDGVARVVLGGVDNVDIQGMSGAWEIGFTLSSAANVTVTFDWQLLASSEFEFDEASRAIAGVDGANTILATFLGDGNGGPDMDTGVQPGVLNFSLTAGDHTLSLGGDLNKKTFNDEQTEIFYNNVKITIAGVSCTGPVVTQLDTKTVNFGSITVACDGTVDYSNVEGVDAPFLRVRPFFAEGRTRSIREFIFGALNDEMGIQIHDPVLCEVTDPTNPVGVEIESPAGFVYNRCTDEFERPPGCGGASEVDVAIVDHLEFYLLNYFKPGRYLETARTQQGDTLLDTVGCTECHVRDLVVDSDRRVADVETTFNSTDGIFNELFATASTRFVAVPDPDSPFPFVLPAGNSFVVENIFTDFKRHDLGPDFDERDYDHDEQNHDGTAIKMHITEALWGVGSTSPYGHDGRSINLDAVIRRHGGEAAASTLAYANLSEDDQSKILEFLSTLILFPPDDTASNLNVGNPSGNPQFPSNHGSINLGALFQIDSDDIGPE